MQKRQVKGEKYQKISEKEKMQQYGGERYKNLPEHQKGWLSIRKIILKSRKTFHDDRNI